MTVQAILARLQGAKRKGSGWNALCPAHEDRNPSLSIHECDGRILVHCFAGCSVESICEALQIRVSDLFSERGAARESKPEIVRRVQRQLADLRSRLTPPDRERAVTVVLCDVTSLDAGLARALALAVEGELVQVALESETQ
jgi:hypothetical protein